MYAVKSANPINRVNGLFIKTLFNHREQHTYQAARNTTSKCVRP